MTDVCEDEEPHLPLSEQLKGQVVSKQVCERVKKAA